MQSELLMGEYAIDHRNISFEVNLAASAATDMLHIGNRWINHAGLGYYDNTARYYDALTVRFTAADSHERKYLTMIY